MLPNSRITYPDNVLNGLLDCRLKDHFPDDETPEANMIGKNNTALPTKNDTDLIPFLAKRGSTDCGSSSAVPDATTAHAPDKSTATCCSAKARQGVQQPGLTLCKAHPASIATTGPQICRHLSVAIFNGVDQLTAAALAQSGQRHIPVLQVLKSMESSILQTLESPDAILTYNPRIVDHCDAGVEFSAALVWDEEDVKWMRPGRMLLPYSLRL